MDLRSLNSPRKVPFGTVQPPAGGPENMESPMMKEKRAQTLAELQDMFSSSLEPEVVKLILSESDYDVNAALEQLFTLSGSQQTDPEQPLHSMGAASELDDFDVQDGPQQPGLADHFNSTHTDSSVTSRSLYQQRPGSELEVTDGGVATQCIKEQPHLKHGKDFRAAVTLPSLTLGSENRGEFVLHNEKDGDSAHTSFVSGTNSQDNVDGVTSRPADNPCEPFPQRPDTEDPPISGLGEYRGSLEKFLSHVLISDGPSESKEWNSNVVSDGLNFEAPHAGGSESQTSTSTTSKYKGKDMKRTSSTSNHPSPKLSNSSSLVSSHTAQLNSLPKGSTDFHNSNFEKSMHRKQNVSTSDHSQAERKSNTNDEKRQQTRTVKLNHNPPQIQRHHFAPNFGSPNPRGNTLVQPLGGSILGYGPPGNNVRGPSGNFNRGTTWTPYRFDHRHPLLPDPPMQQFHQNTPGPGIDAIRAGRPNFPRHPFAKLLIIMRGLPGSGKSTLAWRLKQNGVILTTDDFFMINGRYEFDVTQLGQAHEWTQRRAKEAMEKGITPLIIDNTNTQAWEMKPYVSMGLQFGYTVIFREPDTWWKFNLKELARRNQHKVGIATIGRMLERYERNMTVEKVMNSSRELRADSTKGAENRPDQTRERSPKPDNGNMKPNGDSPGPRGVPQNEGGTRERSPRNRKATASPDIEKTKITGHGANMETSSRDNSPLLVNDGDDDVIVESDESSDDEQHDRLSRQSNSCRRPQIVNLPDSHSISRPERTASKRNPAELGAKEMPTASDLRHLASENRGGSGPAGTHVLEEIMTVESGNLAAAPDAVNEAAATSVPEEKDSDVDGIEFLKTCFPDLDYSIVESLLSSNDGDVVKTVEIILASCDEDTQKSSSAMDSERLPGNEASLPRNSEHNTESLGSMLHPADVSVPGCSGVPDFPDSFTYAGASGNMAADRLCYPSAHPSRANLGGSPEAGARNAPTSQPVREGLTNPKVPRMPSARPLDPSRVQAMTTKETSTITSSRVSGQSLFDLNKGEEEPVFDTSCFQLSLEPAVAFHLIEMFGPLTGTDLKDELSPEDLVVKVDSAFAESLYKEWKKSVQARQPATATATGGQARTDASMLKNSPGQKKARKLRRLVRDKDVSPNWQDGREKGTKQLKMDPFRDIMDEQLAIELSKQAKRDVQVDTADIATVLKQKKLHSMFPGIDPAALDDLFESNGRELGPTVEMVKASCGMLTAEQPPVIAASGFARPEGEQKKERTTEQAEPQLTKEVAKTDEGSLFSHEALPQSLPVAGDSFQTLKDPDYRDFRAEADVHYKLRDECFKKAALAFSKKQGELAQFFARQGHEHTQKIKEANERAAAMILRQKNSNRSIDEIDLHGLHVQEALLVLEQMLTAWKPEAPSGHSPRPSPKVISVVTGRGMHSRGGKARIKPAVLDYLRRNHYSYTELNAGLVQVTLH